MQNEIIRISPPRVLQGCDLEEIQAESIVIPDVRCLALCLPKIEETLLFWSYQTATDTLDKIIKRKKVNSVKEMFQTDVPNLYNTAQRFPKEECEIIMDFWCKYVAIVQHFIKEAKPVPYFFAKTKKQMGMRYFGWAWFSRE